MSLDLVSIRRRFHMYPELSFEEVETSNYIVEVLKSLGLNPVRFAKTGVYVDIGQDEEQNNIIAFRADIDALPVQELSDVEYKSKIEGKMHACGHDVHATVALGLAEKLSNHKDDLIGKVRIIFQPAEEKLNGAQAVIDSDVLKGVKAVYGMHSSPDLEVGKISFSETIMAACSKFKFTIEGVGGHGATPHKTANPVLAASNVVMTLQTIVGKNIWAMDPTVLTVCKISGGTAFNIVPNAVEIEGTARYLSPEVQTSLPQIMEDIAKDISRGYGCKAELEYTELVPPLINDKKLMERSKIASKGYLGEDNVIDIAPTMTSEDFAIYGKFVPICYFWLGVGGEYGLHNPRFDINEDSLEIGANTVFEIIKDAIEIL